MSQWKQHRTSLEEYQARVLDRRYPRYRPPNADELREMLRGHTWSYFANHFVRKINGIRFSCGIGIHLGRPCAAVAAHAQFLALKPVPPVVADKIKRISGYDEWGLHTLIWLPNGKLKPLSTTQMAKTAVPITLLDKSAMWRELIIPRR